MLVSYSIIYETISINVTKIVLCKLKNMDKT